MGTSKAPISNAEIFVRFIARFFTAQPMLTMLLHDRAEKLFYLNRRVQDQRSRAVECGDVSPLLKFATANSSWGGRGQVRGLQSRA
jgi:hypothetical protein